jgi:hypothetical protein
VRTQRPSRSCAAGCQLAGVRGLDWLCVMCGFFLGWFASLSSKPLMPA